MKYLRDNKKKAQFRIKRNLENNKHMFANETYQNYVTLEKYIYKKTKQIKYLNSQNVWDDNLIAGYFECPNNLKLPKPAVGGSHINVIERKGKYVFLSYFSIAINQIILLPRHLTFKKIYFLLKNLFGYIFKSVC